MFGRLDFQISKINKNNGIKITGTITEKEIGDLNKLGTRIEYVNFRSNLIK